MSTLPDHEPACTKGNAAIDLIIEGRARDLGGFTVRRVLPSPLRRMVGPFIFFDHMGPVDLPPGKGMDVRPHPHIALATITYLFSGEIIHKDSLGSDQPIRPGDVNWMTAGRGIVHSERTGEGTRARGSHMHGIQSWVALPTSDEETAPRFEHYPASTIPRVELPGAKLAIVAGTAYGKTSPTKVSSPTLYVHAALDAGADLTIDDAYEERAIYIADGTVQCEGRDFHEGTMLVLCAGAPTSIRAVAAANVILVGGAPIDGPRFIWWNFVASSKERIERAKADWKEGRFPKVPGDDVELIPLPEG